MLHVYRGPSKYPQLAHAYAYMPILCEVIQVQWDICAVTGLLVIYG